MLSIPTKAIADKVLAVGSQSGREMDKFAAYSVATLPAAQVQAPLIDGCVAWLECRVFPEAHNQKRYDLFIAEVVAKLGPTPPYSTTDAGPLSRMTSEPSTTSPAAVSSPVARALKLSEAHETESESSFF